MIVPGLVDTATGTAVYAENLGWQDVPFVDRLTEASGLPVAFDHDVRSAGAAEQRFGAGRGYRDVAFVPIGTGISAALVLDGRPYRSAWAGEIGHIDVGSGLPCPCGARGLPGDGRLGRGHRPPLHRAQRAAGGGRAGRGRAPRG